ncbi:MAG: copper resistance protein CopD [Halobacteriaceae archaeon]
MNLVLLASYVLHVVSGTFWVGAVLYVAAAIMPVATEDALSPGAFETTMDRLLTITRWTGVALPLTGVYQLWVLYPTTRLLGTSRGYLVLAMLGLWTIMNGLVEAGIYRIREAAGSAPGVLAYLTAGLAVDGGLGNANVGEVAAAGQGYLRVAALFGIGLLVDAGVLASGIPLPS